MSLLRHSTWNLLGVVIPIVIAVPALGVMARYLGVEPFGLYTLSYAVIGYASLFDMGMSRAVIRAVAMHGNDDDKVRAVLGTSSTLVLLLSLLAGAILVVFSSSLVRVLGVSPEYLHVAEYSLCILGVAMPAFLLSMVWFAYLEGRQEFYKLNVLRTISGLLIALFPLVFVLVTPTLLSAVMGLVVARYLTLLMALVWSVPSKNIKYLFSFDKATFHELIQFGGWISVSNLVSPIMVYFDRFFISSITGTQHIAFYTTPSEAVARGLVLPASMVRVIFTRLSAKSASAAEDTRLTYLILVALCGAMSIIGALFAKEIMLIWMGESYTGVAATVLSILMIGFFCNSIAQIPFAVIQAAGHAKITALLHIVELLPYIALLFFLVHQYGMVGAAIAWSVRVAVDCIALIFLSKKYC